MKATIRNNNEEMATAKYKENYRDAKQRNVVELNKETKKTILTLIIDVEARGFTKEKKALFDIANGKKKKLATNQAKRLKEYVEDSKAITGYSKRKYLDTISQLAYGYITR